MYFFKLGSWKQFGTITVRGRIGIKDKVSQRLLSLHLRADIFFSRLSFHIVHDLRSITVPALLKKKEKNGEDLSEMYCHDRPFGCVKQLTKSTN